MLAISIYNKKGGVGKSLFSIVISSWFGHNGKKTTLLDLESARREFALCEHRRTGRNKTNV
ncbi:AAA family ATPase [Klebsiella pneumoniae]|uniref:AAA family ATPase n=1 Tax=Klebsiella pneumoniae TaxID=573 RepID=UPI001E650B24|nr:AAA family ATPase [Klebsiella pneumoniae]